MFNLINTYLKKFFRFYNLKSVKAKNIMINSNDFNIRNLKLANTYKVHEEILVENFVSKIKNENLTIIVVDNKGQTKGYINQQQIENHYAKF